MKKSLIYTRSGDEGKTSLVSGSRVKKSNLRINMYGDLDELNSFIGLAISYLDRKKFNNEVSILEKIQHIIFDLGSNLACEKNRRADFKLPFVKKKDVVMLENAIDDMDSKLHKLKCFILPGGSVAGAHFHVCRTICRRVERMMILFEDSTDESNSPQDLAFMNRLSDYFFVLSRYINKLLDKEEVYWRPDA